MNEPTDRSMFQDVPGPSARWRAGYLVGRAIVNTCVFLFWAIVTLAAIMVGTYYFPLN